MSTRVKDKAAKIVENLSDDATWDDLVYEIYVRQMIEEGLADSDAGRGIPVEEVWRRFV
jgi:hypothetical protein